MLDSIRVFIAKHHRAVVLSSNGYNLSFQRYRPGQNGSHFDVYMKTPTVIIKTISDTDLFEDQGDNYFEITSLTFKGMLGLITANNSIYLGLVTGVQSVGYSLWTMRGSRVTPLQRIHKVLDVDFFCLDNGLYDVLFMDKNEQNTDKLLHEHPCGALKKLFSDGTFYFSNDYDITNNVRRHGLVHTLEQTIDNQDQGFVWNFSLTDEILSWRQRLPRLERKAFDASSLLLFTIRGFCRTTLVETPKFVASITLISRISIEKGPCSLDTEGIDDRGKVSNFVETEIVVNTEKFVFSYTQVSGSIPLSWEVVDSQFLHGRKIKITKNALQTQAAFDKHMDSLEVRYGVVSIVNLFKSKSETQELLKRIYTECAEAKDVKITNIEITTSSLTKSPHKVLYMLNQDILEFGAFAYDISRGIYFGRQTGVLRISAFDNIAKQILLERIISGDVLELATKELDGFLPTTAFLGAHDKLWSENSYWIDRIFTKNWKNTSKYAKIYTKLLNSKVMLFDPLHFYISHYLKQREQDYTDKRTVSLFCGTFNVSGRTSEDSIDEWIFPEDSGLDDKVADAYIIGLEEVVELTPGHILSTDPYAKQYWERRILTLINGKKKGRKFCKVWSGQLGGILAMFFIKDTEYDRINHVEADVKKTGFGGMASNKGAVAISFKYNATSFCVVVSHLAAGLENVEQRHNDYKTIFKNIRFARGLRIKDHDAIIWMGDFNYRILMSNDEVRQLITLKDYATLLQKDQLNQQMTSGESFPYFHEMPISFPPTYKFDPGTRTYDTSEKMRIPAWTDRILSRGEVLKQLRYSCAENILFSDHRPVFAMFRARISVVDESKKLALFKEIYDDITKRLSTLSEEERMAFFDGTDVSLWKLKQEGTIPGKNFQIVTGSATQGETRRKSNKLPPPSSDANKWWIGNGRQVKVTLDINPAEYMLNPMRDPNPFVEDDTEPLFVPRPKEKM